MINVTIYEDLSGGYIGFDMTGHAGYAAEGRDIVCAAVSVLAINTVDSIEAFTDDHITYDTNNDGYLTFRIHSSPVSREAELFMKSFLLGLDGVTGSYGKKYLNVDFKKETSL